MNAVVDVGTAEMLRLAGMTYRQLDYWTRRGTIRAYNPAAGSGSPRRFPAEEVAVACALVRLMEAGLPLDLAAYVARRPVPLPGDRRAERIGRGVVLMLYPDLWQVDDPNDDDPVVVLPRQETER